MDPIEILSNNQTRLEEKVAQLTSAADISKGKKLREKAFYVATTVAVGAVLAVVLRMSWDATINSAINSFVDEKTNLTLSQLADKLGTQIEQTKSIGAVIESNKIMTWDQPAYIVFDAGGAMRYTGNNRWDIVDEKAIKEENDMYKSTNDRKIANGVRVWIRRLTN